MNMIMIIALRDFKSLVFKPMFSVIAALCTILWSYSYIKNLIDFAYSSSSPQVLGATKISIYQAVVMGHFSIVNMVLIFAIPALTMKLIAEEKRNRTFDLLLTSPISATQIAIGKFIGGYLVALVLVVIAFLYPLATMIFAEIDLSLLLSAFVGVCLVTAAYVAIGLFSSSLSSSLVVSVIAGVAINLMLWFISQGTLYSNMPWLVSVMDHLSLGDNLFAFMKGLIKTSSVVYFLSATTLFIFLSQKVIESARWR